MIAYVLRYTRIILDVLLFFFSPCLIYFLFPGSLWQYLFSAAEMDGAEVNAVAPAIVFLLVSISMFCIQTNVCKRIVLNTAHNYSGFKIALIAALVMISWYLPFAIAYYLYDWCGADKFGLETTRNALAILVPLYFLADWLPYLLKQLCD